MDKVILASTSPRRKELLQLLEIPFQIASANVDESFDKTLSPAEIVQTLALRKARAVAKDNKTAVVIGADTIVVLKDEILGKPSNSTEAIAMLTNLSGKTHSVYTGVALVQNDKQMTFFEKTNVLFWELTTEEINSYVKTGEPFDKAGGYGIQDVGATLVKKINGDYYNVVGLPVSKLVRQLRAFLKS